MDAVSAGTVEMGHTAPYYYFGKDPAFAFDCAVPFGLTSRQQTAWIDQGGGRALMREFYQGYGIVNFLGGNTGTQMGGWYRKPVKTLADIKGMKIRIAGFAGRVMERMGAVPQQIAGSDVYAALEKGTIDAAEWVGPYDDEKLGFYKVAKYYYYPGWWEGTSCYHLMVNLAKWNELPKHYQNMIQVASGDAWGWVIGKYDYANPAALKKLISQGAILRPFPQPVLEACYNAAQEVYAEHMKTNPLFKKMHDSLIPFRNDSFAWWPMFIPIYSIY